MGLDSKAYTSPSGTYRRGLSAVSLCLLGRCESLFRYRAFAPVWDTQGCRLCVLGLGRSLVPDLSPMLECREVTKNGRSHHHLPSCHRGNERVEHMAAHWTR